MKGKRISSLSIVALLVLQMVLLALPPAAMAADPPDIDGFLDPVYVTNGTQVEYANVGGTAGSARLYVLDDAAKYPDYIYLAEVISVAFVDNSYDEDFVASSPDYTYLHPSWIKNGAPAPHTFWDLLSSDMQQIVLYNNCDSVNPVLNMTMDLIAQVPNDGSVTTPSGYWPSQNGLA